MGPWGHRALGVLPVAANVSAVRWWKVGPLAHPEEWTFHLAWDFGLSKFNCFFDCLAFSALDF